MMLNFETLKASLVMYGLDAIYAILLLIFGWWLSEVAQRFVFRLLTVTHQVDALVTAFVASLVRYAILAVIGIAVLQLFGIETASLVAVLGATSLAIGLALQGTLSNLAAGVMLLVFRPFGIGHHVEVGGKAGEVRSLSLFMTELKAPDNTQILLPNASVWGQPIINRSAYPATGELKVSPRSRGTRRRCYRSVRSAESARESELGPAKPADRSCFPDHRHHQRWPARRRTHGDRPGQAFRDRRCEAAGAGPHRSAGGPKPETRARRSGARRALGRCPTISVS